MSSLTSSDFPRFYEGFYHPITSIDCGQRCSPHNRGGAPFCCDSHHAVSAALPSEWEFLHANTGLWHLWRAETEEEILHVNAQTPPGLVLIECQGYARCQREFRSMTCRAFPFFPYIDQAGEFVGLSYHWEYEDRCWVISHLDQVTPAFRQEFAAAYTRLFDLQPSEYDTFYHYSSQMRRIFSQRRRSIPLLHRNGKYYKINPHNGKLRPVSADRFPRFGPYQVGSLLPLSNEVV